MGEAARVPVQTHDVVVGDVLVVIDGIPKTESRRQQVGEIIESVKQVCALRKLVIRFADYVGLAEGLRERTRRGVQRSTNRNRGGGVLLRSLRVEEEEQFVLDQRAAEASTKLRALEWRFESRRHREVGCHRAVAEEAETFAVEGVGPRSRGHVDRARRTQVL